MSSYWRVIMKYQHCRRQSGDVPLFDVCFPWITTHFFPVLQMSLRDRLLLTFVSFWGLLHQSSLSSSGANFTFSQTTDFFTLSDLKRLLTTILHLMTMTKSSPKGYKTQWENEKLLVRSIFSFSNVVFKRLAPQTRKDMSLYGKGLKR